MVPKEQLLEKRVGALEKKVDDGFTRVDTDIRELRGDVKKLDEKLTGKIEKLDEKLTGEIKDLDEKLTGKIEGVDKKVTKRIEGVEERLTRRFDRLTLILIGSFVGVVISEHVF